MWSIRDDDLTLRSFHPDDEAALLAGRDDEWRRWLGPGDDHPAPTACIEIDDAVVGWVDSDPTATDVGAGETNVGYHVFAGHRGRGVATRALSLLLRRLADEGDLHTACLEIQPANIASIRVAEKAGFVRSGDGPGGHRYRRAIDPAP